MLFKDFTKEEIKKCFDIIDNYLASKEIKFTKFVDLGCKIVRLIGYSEEFIPHIEKQLTFGLRNESDKYDATLILWKEEDILALSKYFSKNFNKIAIKTRFETTFRKARKVEYNENDIYYTQIIDDDFSKIKPIIDIQTTRGYFIGNNKAENTYYYGVNNLDPEEFIKEGHLFVQFLNNILKTETSNLVHGAVIGYNGNGICFCARGQRGKSTLSVLSMMKGFEYVSDDYLILHQNEKKELLSSPIYSIITLSPEMYNRLYDYMQGSQFVSNNARKDKYVFNISNFHDSINGQMKLKNWTAKLTNFLNFRNLTRKFLILNVRHFKLT